MLPEVTQPVSDGARNAHITSVFHNLGLIENILQHPLPLSEQPLSLLGPIVCGPEGLTVGQLNPQTFSGDCRGNLGPDLPPTALNIPVSKVGKKETHPEDDPHLTRHQWEEAQELEAPGLHNRPYQCPGHSLRPSRWSATFACIDFQTK